MTKRIMWVFPVLSFPWVCYCGTGEGKGFEAPSGKEVTQFVNHVADWPGKRARCRPVALKNIKVSGFLGRRIDRNAPSILAALESPLAWGFEARAQGKEPPPETRRLAADSDLYKWLEGASYAYAYTKNPDVRKALDRIGRLILTCQKSDGYINTQVPPKKRFDPRVNHDLYIAGHFFEGAVAHWRATGNDALLQAACRWADYLIQEYHKDNPYYQRVGDKEHSEYELGFLRLYRATGHKAYLEFAGQLARMCRVGPRVAEVRAGGGLHAVRVGYLLASYADLYLETGESELYQHLLELWEELVETRLYVTGGMGITESIPSQPYHLPHAIEDHPRRDIAETCASVAMMMFSWRMHSLTGESRKFDVIENILYNHYLGALALDHLGNFYYNPLRLVGDPSGRTDHDGPKTHRLRLPKIHSTACCLPNCWRFIGALPEYVMSYDEEGVYINLYTSAKVDQKLSDGRDIALSIETRYPHDGKVTIRFEGEQATSFILRLRIPAWCLRAQLISVEGTSQRLKGGQYYPLERKWKKGDTITLQMEMPVRMIPPDPRVEANKDQVVFAHGPLVYCLENQDVDFPVEFARIRLLPEELASKVQVEWRENLLDGINVLRVPGFIASVKEKKNTSLKATEFQLIPFYARANRDLDNRWITFIPILRD